MKKKLVFSVFLFLLMTVSSLVQAEKIRVYPCQMNDIRFSLDSIETLKSEEGINVVLKVRKPDDLFNRSYKKLKLLPSNPNFEYILLMITKSKRDYSKGSSSNPDEYEKTDARCMELGLNITTDDNDNIVSIEL